MNHTLLLAHMLLVLFVGLKLTGYIAWSWWLVFAPLWGPVLLRFVIGWMIGFVAAYRLARRKARLGALAADMRKPGWWDNPQHGPNSRKNKAESVQ